MLNKIALIILLTLSFYVSGQDSVEINPEHPDRYVVVKGDTLWDIAGRFLTEPWRWPEIWETNPQIENPHLIYPGDVVSLVFDGGRPILTVERGVAGTGGRTGAGPGRNVKLSPEIREFERQAAIPTIPIEAIRHFLTRPLIVDENEMEAWPYIVSNYGQRLIAGAQNQVYIRGISRGDDTETYAVYRKGEPLIAYSSNKGAILGYEALYVGDAVIVKQGDPATGIITQSDREILNGDRLAPLSDDEIYADFIPRLPSESVDGSIISVIDGVSQISQYQVVVLDVGERDGLEQGNVLGIYQAGKLIQDKTGLKKGGKTLNDTALVEYLGKPRAAGEPVQLPEEYAGVVMIFRTFDRLSYGLIMEATAPIHLYDTVKNL
jgi:hypothetical protein